VSPTQESYSPPTDSNQSMFNTGELDSTKDVLDFGDLGGDMDGGDGVNGVQVCTRCLKYCAKAVLLCTRLAAMKAVHSGLCISCCNEIHKSKRCSICSKLHNAESSTLGTMYTM